MKTLDAKRKAEAKQFLWETWFIVSFILCVAFILVGMLDNSKELTALPYLIVTAMLNLLVCSFIGIKPREVIED